MPCFQREGDLDFHYRIGAGQTRSQQRAWSNLLCNDLYHLVRLYRYQFGMREQAPVDGTSSMQSSATRSGDGRRPGFYIRASRGNVERLSQNISRVRMTIESRGRKFRDAVATENRCNVSVRSMRTMRRLAGVGFQVAVHLGWRRCGRFLRHSRISRITTMEDVLTDLKRITDVTSCRCWWISTPVGAARSTSRARCVR